MNQALNSNFSRSYCQFLVSPPSFVYAKREVVSRICSTQYKGYHISSTRASISFIINTNVLSNKHNKSVGSQKVKEMMLLYVGFQAMNRYLPQI